MENKLEKYPKFLEMGDDKVKEYIAEYIKNRTGLINKTRFPLDVIDDCKQDLFLIMYENRHLYNPSLGAFSTWAYSYTIKIINQRRLEYKQDHQCYANLLSIEKGKVKIHDPFKDKTTLEDKEFVMTNVLDCLSDEQRKIAICYYYERVPVIDIAKMYNYPQPKIYNILKKIRYLAENPKLQDFYYDK